MNPEESKPRSFAALRHPGYRTYFVLTAVTMMGDNIEHVISYWLIFQKFQSPALGGFAVLAHWLPFLFFALWSGALADRYDPRRMIQIGMGMFIYGKKTQQPKCLGIGAAMCVFPYFVHSMLLMWGLAALGMAGAYFLPRFD